MRIRDWSSDVCSSDLGETVWIGKAEMFGVEGIPTLNAAATDAIAILREGGRTTMVVRKGDKDIGAIGLMDTPREAAKVALKRLREMGITRMIMISGDHQRSEEHTSELQSLMRNSYAVFCLTKTHSNKSNSPPNLPHQPDTKSTIQN